ncbi:MAG: hypothetical protein ACJ77Z_15780 [Thermoleophilaceae bacterium]|jgi:hypothetical protein
MGFLDRLLGRGVENKTFTRTTVKQHFRIKVPADQATAVQAALERWAQSKGWAAIVNSEREGDQVSLSLEHDESGSGTRPQIDTDKMSEELQKVIQDAIKPPP